MTELDHTKNPSEPQFKPPQIYEAESTPHAESLIRQHNIRYVFDTTYNWDVAVLREFSPCVLIDACIAADLFEDGVLTRYDSYAYEVRVWLNTDDASEGGAS